MFYWPRSCGPVQIQEEGKQTLLLNGKEIKEVLNIFNPPHQPFIYPDKQKAKAETYLPFVIITIFYRKYIFNMYTWKKKEVGSEKKKLLF